MFYYIALKYENFLLETLDTFPLLKDAYTQSRKLHENRISSWYGALQQILNNIPKLKQLSTNQKVSKQTVSWTQNYFKYRRDILAVNDMRKWLSLERDVSIYLWIL